MNGPALMLARPIHLLDGITRLDGARALLEMGPTLLLVAATAALFAAITAMRSKGNRSWHWMVSAVSLLVSASWLGVNLVRFKAQAILLLDGKLRVDGFSLLCAGIATFVAFGAALWAFTAERAPDFRGKPGLLGSEGSALVMISVAGMHLTLFASDLLILLIALEVAALPLVWLLGDSSPFSKDRPILKSLVGHLVSSGLLLWACVLLVIVTGTTGFDRISIQMGEGWAHPAAGVGIILLLSALSWKCAAAPLGLSGPSAAAGSPPPLQLLLQAALHLVVAAALFRVFLVGFVSEALAYGPGGWTSSLAVIAGITIVAGSSAAMWQRRMADMTAHLSIAATGFLLLGLVAAGLEGPDKGKLAVSASAYLLANHGLGVLGLVLMAFHIEKDQTALPGDDLGLPTAFCGLGKSRPALAFLVAVFLFQVAGLPPSAAFFARLNLVLTVLRNEALLGLGLLMVFAWAVGAVAVMRVLRGLYAVSEMRSAPEVKEAGGEGEGEGPKPEDVSLLPAAVPARSTPATPAIKPLGYLLGGLLSLLVLSILAAAVCPDPFLRGIHKLFIP